MAFFQRLEQSTIIERQALNAVPQILDGLAGRISLSTWLAYLAEAYHHVRHTVPLLTLARDGLDPAHRRFRAALDDYISEETGHEQWILNDIACAGGDAIAVRDSKAGEATARMVAFAYDYVRRVNPMGLFGMIYVLEGTSVALASQGAAKVAGALGLGSDCFTYLASHGSLDKAHLAFFASLMDRIEEPADEQSIIEVARAVFRLFADMFRSIPHDRSLVHAV